MTEKLQLYRCNICNNLVEVLIEGKGELVCCGQPMELITEHESDVKELNDKHVPVIEKTIELETSPFQSYRKYSLKSNCSAHTNHLP